MTTDLNSAVTAESTTVVETAQGSVRGARRDGVDTFLAIPYAAPPRGADRFAPPRPHEPWDDVRDATVPGPNAPQSVRSLGQAEMTPYFGEGWSQGEDYLTLNVWSPSSSPATTDPRAVIVFVHGGGFVAGSTRASLYEGTSFARDGVVFVTLNYRLGIAGFLDLPDAPANRGLLDVVAGLEWVRENIAAFGGDPDNVTLAGQSAGATIVGGVLATPQASGLIRRAIVQSGSGLGAFSPEQAARVTHEAARRLGIEATAAAFAEISDEQLVDVAGQLAGIDLDTDRARDPLVGLSPFSLVSAVQPAQGVASGMAADVDVMVGTNAEEGNLYLVPFGNYRGTTEQDVLRTAERAHPEPADLVRAYARSRPDASPARLRSAILGDALFGSGTWALLGAHAARADAATYAYEFTWRSGALDGDLGATHAMELPFVFDTVDLPALRGTRALLGPDEVSTELARRMHAAWVEFARTGDPGWQPYTGEDRATMRIGEQWELVMDPHRYERLAWGNNARAATRTVISTPRAPRLSAPLAQGVRKGAIVQVAGQLPLDPESGQLVGDTVAEQTAQCMANVIEVLKAGGASLSDVVMVRVYLTDPAHLTELNTTYAQLVGEPFPPRTTTYTALPLGALVEIDVLAVVE